MKIVNDHIEGSSEPGKKSNFSIKQSAHAIHVLSTSLYTNPVKAIIRELMCNAWDSHKSAGKTDTPVLLHIPHHRESNKIFFIRDYGLGLAPSQIEGLYTTYFDWGLSLRSPTLRSFT